MSYWHAEFQAAFFDEWMRQGLPEPHQQTRAERTVALPEEVHRVLDGSRDRALRRSVVAEVFGFGRLIGLACGELFRLDAARTAARADWCGRFNLGISLFDYLCDEAADDPVALVAGLPAFAPFARTPAKDGAPGEIGRALDRLVAGLLTEFAAELGPPTVARRRSGLWGALDKMFAAELWVATNHPRPGADAVDVMQRLRTKSSEAFRVMAEWTARAGRGVASRRAAHFGRALGDCYWLIDDARDVWADLDAGRWNYFLVAAAKADPNLRLDSPSPVLEARLVKLWRAHRLVRRATRTTVRRFTKALRGLAADSGTVQRIADRLVGTMARWSR